MRAGLARESGVAVGPFELASRLGGGAETEVWRADGDGIVVALKLLRDPRDGFARARLAREAAALRRVDHQGVVRLFDAGEEDGEPFLALSLHDAGTFGTLLDEGPVDASQVAAVLAPVADVLAAFHAAGIVHRDVKPGNILLSADGPVLIDFGAAAIDGTTLDGWLDGADAVLATPAYAPPDLHPTPAYDVWSMGVILREAVSGAVDGELADLIAACSAIDPQLRPTAAVVASTLRRLAGETVPPVVSAPLVLERGTGPAWPGPAPREEHGRELELARLTDEFDAACAAAELRTTFVTAPAGMGKSWLLDAATSRVAEHGALVLRAACSEAVGDLRTLASWLRRIGSVTQLGELVGEHHASTLLHATGMQVGAGSTADVESAAIAESFAALLGACATPTAVIDDFHHASPELIDVVGRLAFRSGISGVLWLGGRPGHVDSDDLDVQTMALGPLADEVIVDLAGAEAAELAGGNPLLARELAFARAAGADLGGDVHELVRARLDRLDERVVAGVSIAATCGDVFWPEALGTAASLPALCREGFVRLRVGSLVDASTEAEWTHPLLREVAYTRLDDRARRIAHLDVARSLDGARADVETVAHHAAVSFESGERGELEFIADTTARAGRAALDRFALANAERWTSVLERTSLDPIPGTADTLRAELLLRRGEFAASAHLADRWTDRDDDIGTRALSISAEAHLATGELDLAEAAGAAALERLPDSLWRDQVTSTYATALSQQGRNQEAANLTESASNAARARGDRGFAARLQAQSAFSAAERARGDGSDVVPSIASAITALDELEAVGDHRAFVTAAYELAELISVVDPPRTLSLLVRAADYARALADETAVARIAYYASTVAMDLGDADSAERWLRQAETAPTDEALGVLVRSFRCVFDLARGAVGREAWQELEGLVGVSVTAYETVLQFQTGVAQWFGWTDELRRSIDALEPAPVLQTLACLGAATLSGPPWCLPDIDPALTNTVANELALIELLRGKPEAASVLLRRRFAFLSATGSTYQRYNACFSGALVAALGPADTEPRVDWLVGQILNSEFPQMWAVHRAICAVLLAERGVPDGDRLARTGLRLLHESKADPQVNEWLVPRLQAAISAR